MDEEHPRFGIQPNKRTRNYPEQPFGDESQFPPPFNQMLQPQNFQSSQPFQSFGQQSPQLLQQQQQQQQGYLRHTSQQNTYNSQFPPTFNQGLQTGQFIQHQQQHPMGYSASPGQTPYGVPLPQGAYGQPLPGYGASQFSNQYQYPPHQQQQQQQQQPPPQGDYGAPPQGYGAPPLGYSAPPPQGAYGQPPPQGAYGAPHQGAYGAPPPGYGAPPPQGAYEQPPPGYGDLQQQQPPPPQQSHESPFSPDSLQQQELERDQKLQRITAQRALTRDQTDVLSHLKVVDSEFSELPIFTNNNSAEDCYAVRMAIKSEFTKELLNNPLEINTDGNRPLSMAVVIHSEIKKICGSLISNIYSEVKLKTIIIEYLKKNGIIVINPENSKVFIDEDNLKPFVKTTCSHAKLSETITNLRYDHILEKMKKLKNIGDAAKLIFDDLFIYDLFFRIYLTGGMATRWICSFLNTLSIIEQTTKTPASTPKPIFTKELMDEHLGALSDYDIHCIINPEFPLETYTQLVQAIEIVVAQTFDSQIQTNPLFRNQELINEMIQIAQESLKKNDPVMASRLEPIEVHPETCGYRSFVNVFPIFRLSRLMIGFPFKSADGKAICQRLENIPLGKPQVFQKKIDGRQVRVLAELIDFSFPAHENEFKRFLCWEFANKAITVSWCDVMRLECSIPEKGPKDPFSKEYRNLLTNMRVYSLDSILFDLQNSIKESSARGDDSKKQKRENRISFLNTLMCLYNLLVSNSEYQTVYKDDLHKYCIGYAERIFPTEFITKEVSIYIGTLTKHIEQRTKRAEMSIFIVRNYISQYFDELERNELRPADRAQYNKVKDNAKNMYVEFYELVINELSNNVSIITPVISDLFVNCISLYISLPYNFIQQFIIFMFLKFVNYVMQELYKRKTIYDQNETNASKSRSIMYENNVAYSNSLYGYNAAKADAALQYETNIRRINDIAGSKAFLIANNIYRIFRNNYEGKSFNEQMVTEVTEYVYTETKTAFKNAYEEANDKTANAYSQQIYDQTLSQKPGNNAYAQTEATTARSNAISLLQTNSEAKANAECDAIKISVADAFKIAVKPTENIDNTVTLHISNHVLQLIIDAIRKAYIESHADAAYIYAYNAGTDDRNMAYRKARASADATIYAVAYIAGKKAYEATMDDKDPNHPDNQEIVKAAIASRDSAIATAKNKVNTAVAAASAAKAGAELDVKRFNHYNERMTNVYAQEKFSFDESVKTVRTKAYEETMAEYVAKYTAYITSEGAALEHIDKHHIKLKTDAAAKEAANAAADAAADKERTRYIILLNPAIEKANAAAETFVETEYGKADYIKLFAVDGAADINAANHAKAKAYTDYMTDKNSNDENVKTYAKHAANKAYYDMLINTAISMMRQDYVEATTTIQEKTFSEAKAAAELATNEAAYYEKVKTDFINDPTWMIKICNDANTYTGTVISGVENFNMEINRPKIKSMFVIFNRCISQSLFDVYTKKYVALIICGGAAVHINLVNSLDNINIDKIDYVIHVPDIVEQTIKGCIDSFKEYLKSSMNPVEFSMINIRKEPDSKSNGIVYRLYYKFDNPLIDDIHAFEILGRSKNMRVECKDLIPYFEVCLIEITFVHKNPYTDDQLTVHRDPYYDSLEESDPSKQLPKVVTCKVVNKSKLILEYNKLFLEDTHWYIKSIYLRRIAALNGMLKPESRLLYESEFQIK